ncbi:NINE protein [Mycoplasma nasistruthionis]|uniref:TM2 domain-containing protein n=1 Tax=Mycoplasma nasistruthionis TaxID=353852 RepID=A0A4Y6I747_9MOLU|nr:NINE protein [Mycoplasma nasistruthionis]QCZ36865.1 TM2 domain-containing protein [Mycoplasma nasistruthionis]QDF65140.1 TM2 domain-containing protein [Mycoplasma nasistruthionis]
MIYSSKSFVLALLLAILLPGIDRMYVGRVGLGILKLFLIICFGIGFVWWIIDIVLLATGQMKDGQGLYIKNV